MTRNDYVKVDLTILRRRQEELAIAIATRKEAEAERDTLRTQNEQLNSEVAKLVDEMARLNKRTSPNAEKIEEHYNAAVRQMEKQDKEIEGLRNQNALIMQQNHAHREETMDHVSSINRLRREVQRLNHKNTNAEVTIGNLMDDRDDLAEQLERAKQ